MRFSPSFCLIKRVDERAGSARKDPHLFAGRIKASLMFSVGLTGILICFFHLPTRTHTLAAQNFSTQNIPAQNLTAQDDPPDRSVVRTVRLSGNRQITTRQLRKLVRTRTNREFFGISRLTPWYYLWQLTGLGESPAYLDREIVSEDMERLQLFYENKGFFEATVDTSIIEYRPQRVEVSFVINEGPRSRIYNVLYSGVPEFEEMNEPADGYADFFRQSLYRDRSPENPDVRTAEEYYDAQKLRDEQTRIVEYLKNRGYAAVVRDSVKARVKRRNAGQEQRARTGAEPVYDVMMMIRPGKLYHFGDLEMSLSAPDEVVTQAELSVVETDSFTNQQGQSYRSVIRIEQGSATDPGLLRNQIEFDPGQRFSQEAYLQSVNQLQNLGILTVNRFGFTPDGSIPDYTRDDLPVYIAMQANPKHSLQMEFFGMQRYGYGSGAGINYNNINVNGQANRLTVGLNASFELITPETVPPSIQIEGSTIFRTFEVRTEYAVPRFVFPFFSDRFGQWYENARTRYSLSYSQSSQLFFNINTDIRFGIRYELAHSGRRSSLLDVIDMDVIDATLTSAFRQNLIDEFGENSVEFLRIEEDFRPQFSSILRYTYRDQNTDLIKRNYGYTAEISIAYGGTIPYLIDRLLSTPETLEGNIPSPLGISGNSLSYSQFLKATLDARRYFEITPLTVLAYRGFAGIAQPLFRSDIIPLNRRFFAGGSSDIRGWFAFQLGPGTIAAEDISVQGGEIKLAAYQEIRQVLFTDLINANWQLAWHVDAGNIWYGPRTTLLDEEGRDLLEDGRFRGDRFLKQIAVGSGFGIRADWDFLIFRFDVTFRAHDLQRGWFENRTPYISFGIGHSF